MKNLAILGSTGSIGCNTLDVVRRRQDCRVFALVAGQNVDVLAAQILEPKSRSGLIASSPF